MNLPGGNPADAIKEIAKEVQEKFDEAGMGKVEEFTDKIDDILDKIKSGPKEKLDAAKAKFGEFKAELEKTLADPSSLAPGGGMAACASFYGNSVAGKLGSLKTESESLIESINTIAKGMEGPLKSLGDTLTSAMDKLEGSLKALAKLPKLVAKEIAGKDSPDDIGKIDTSGMKKALNCGDVDGPLNSITGLKDVLGDAVEAVKKGIKALSEFIEKAPDMVKSAFDVPAPLCFLQSVLLSQAPKAMTDMLAMVEKLNQINLQPIVDMLENATSTIGGLDVNQVKTPMNKFLESAGGLVDKLDNTVKGAKLAGSKPKMPGGMPGF